MSVYAGPNITEDGLIYCIDAFNSKSYPGTGTAVTGLIGSNNATLGANTTYSSSGYFQLDATSASQIATSGTTYPSTWAEPVSYEVWAYFDGDGTWHNTYPGALFARGSTAGTLGLARRNSNNSIGMWIRSDSGSTNPAATITPNTWCHIVGTWNGTNTIAVYLNGVIGGSQSHTATGSPDVGNYGIGGINSTLSGAAGNYMKGRIAIAKMYNKALSAAEVERNFNANRSRFGI